MPTFKGRTDELTKIQLKSYLLSSSWGLSEVAIGAQIPLEVRTAYVADGSDIIILVKDLTGEVIETLKGKIFANYFRMLYRIKENNSGGLFYTSELKAHGLKGTSPSITLHPPLRFASLQWISDENGQPVTQFTAGTTCVLQAELKEGAERAKGLLHLYAQQKGSAEAELIKIFRTEVANSRLTVIWDGKLDFKEKKGSRYESSLTFTATIRGIESAPSQPVTYISLPRFSFSE